MPEHVDTVVIGAGVAGLSTSAGLAAQDVEHVVLERGRVGESWRSQRWDGFRLNTPTWMNRLPGAVASGRPPHAFATRDRLVRELDEYVVGLDLPVREGVRVEALQRRDRGYAIETADGALVARNVVLACGAQTVPRVPARLAAGLATRLDQLHVADYRRPADLPAGGVLIVGSGQSGAQIADELLAARRRVYLATSDTGRMPRWHRGRDVTEWWRDMGRYEQRRDEVGDGARSMGQPLVSGARGRASLSLQGLARRGAVLLGRLDGIDGEHAHLAGDLRDHLAHGDRAAAAARREIDEHIARAGIDAPAHEPEAADRPLSDVVERRRLHLGAEGITTVIWATGFGADFSFVHMPLLDARGLPSHTAGATPAHGLWVVGLPWLTRRSSGILYGMRSDGLEIAARISARARDARPARAA
jgi:putative flavoprotein involved in K+ transport